MPQVRFINPEENAAWDDFVKGHPFGWICHLSSWKKVLEKSFRHITGHYLIIEDKGRIAAGLPLFHVKSRILGDRLVSAPFATLFDPLVDCQIKCDALFEESKNFLHEIGATYLELRFFKATTYLNMTHVEYANLFKHHYIDLSKGLDQIFKNFNRSCVRQRINRAEKSGLVLKYGKTESDLNDFFRLYNITRKRLGLPTHPYRFFINLWNTLFNNKQADLLLVKKDENPIAGLIVLKFKDRYSAEFAASDVNYKQLSPNHFLFWEAIKNAHCHGYSIFDFGRTANDNIDLLKFKRHWGSVEVDLPAYYYHGSPENKAIGFTGSKKEKFVKFICRNSSPAVCRLIGRLVYSHLG